MNGPIKALMRTLEQASKPTKALMQRWADASNRKHHEEADRLWKQIIEERRLDPRDWVPRPRSGLNDDEWDRKYGDDNA